MAELRESENPTQDVEISLGHAVAVLWRSRRFLVLLTLLGGALAAGCSLLLTPIYSAEVSLMPRAQESRQNILGRLASLTDISLGSNSAYEELYGRIISSDRVLDPLIREQWVRESGATPLTLPQAFDRDFDIDESTESRKKLELFKHHLRSGVISFNRRAKTGFMTVHVNVPRYPKLASDLANALVAELDSYLQDLSRRRAADQRRFVENRLEDVETELGEAVDRLSEFEAQNALFQSSPELRLRRAELAREVRAQETVWIELKQQYEIAKIDEQKDTIAVDVLDAATPPAHRSSPWRSMIAILGALIGFGIGCLTVWVRDRSVSLPSHS